MKQKANIQTLLVIVIALIPLLHFAYHYPSLPDRVPTHYNLAGEADSYGHKSTIWLPTLLFCGLTIIIHFLFKYIHLLDPKKSAVNTQPILARLSIFLSLFLAVISISIIQATAGKLSLLEKVLIPGIGLLFAIIGNYMYSIKPNYFVGLRIPWTLEDEDNWRKTHQLMSKLWVIGGSFIAIIGVFVTYKTGIVLTLCVVPIIVIVPIIYSYTIFKKISNEKN